MQRFKCVNNFEQLCDRFEVLLDHYSALRTFRKRKEGGADKIPPGQFFDKISNHFPGVHLYVFGGVLRDLALNPPHLFKSDIDVVVEGDWSELVPFLEAFGAVRNKFGGYRLQLLGAPIDIWDARKTWAIESGLVRYENVSSLIFTTILNWDAVLMSWSTKEFICKDNYLPFLQERILDLVLEENPNPLGMAVRVFRHIAMKDASKAGISVYKYLAEVTSRYTFNELKELELKSYGSNKIDYKYYRYFEMARKFNHLEYIGTEWFSH